MNRETIFSPDRLYRYTLWREWPVEELMFLHGQPKEVMPRGFVTFIGLNPSTANETMDDPTIRKCVGFAKRWGYSAFCMLNLFAFRATNPRVMRDHPNPVGEDNQHHLLHIASRASLVIAAWGTNGSHRNQDLTTFQWLHGIGIRLQCLRVTKHGHPEHPLYIPNDTKPMPYTPA